MEQESEQQEELEVVGEAVPEAESPSLEELALENERLKKQLANKDRSISKRHEEMKRELAAKEARIRELQEELPVGGVALSTEDVKVVSKLSALELEVENLKKSATFDANRSAITEAIPDFDDRIEELAEFSRYMGLPKQNVDTFLANPYAEDPAVLIAAFRQMELYRTQFEEHKKNKGIEKANSNVQTSLSYKPLRNSSGQPAKAVRPDLSTPIHELSDEALKRLINGG